jgi:hypothetical protein
VTITPSQDAALMVDEYPAGTTSCFAASLHRIEHAIRPKAKLDAGRSQGRSS